MFHATKVLILLCLAKQFSVNLHILLVCQWFVNKKPILSAILYLLLQRILKV